MNANRLLVVSGSLFLAGMGIGAAFFFSSRQLRFVDAYISNYLSPEDNPRGYLATAAGTALSALVLLPTALIFYRRLSKIGKWWSMAGVALYAAGLVAAILIGCVAPVRGLDYSVHLALAYVSFISLQAGICVFLTIAARGSKARIAFAAVEWIGAVTLLAVAFGPEWTGVIAFCEWGLCATSAAGLWALASWCS